MTKILTCPFCGTLPAINYRQSGAGYYLVECKNIDCSMIVETRERERDDAIKNWNRRPADTSHIRAPQGE